MTVGIFYYVGHLNNTLLLKSSQATKNLFLLLPLAGGEKPKDWPFSFSVACPELGGNDGEVRENYFWSQ